VPDLYCPGYSPAETLSKEANLMRAAARYKVDATKITANVRARLSVKRKGVRKREHTSMKAPKGPRSRALPRNDQSEKNNPS
jgi:hypothetical protein